MNKESTLLIITNLYPVPWAPHRASFNRQQFELIAEQMPVKLIILLGWLEWFKYRKFCQQEKNIRYCPYFYLPKVGKRFVPFFQYLSLLCLLPWIKKQLPSTLLAAWGFPDAVAVSMLNKHLQLPLLVKVHGTDVNENASYPARAKRMHHWLARAKMIFCASKALANKLICLGIPEEKVQVNYNGVNHEVFYPAKKQSNEIKLIFVGSIIKTKGVVELITALPRVTKQYPNITLIIVGEGPLTSNLMEKAIRLGVNDNVVFKGSLALTEVANNIRQASLLVLPSYREGVPNVLLESFASGTPVVATRVGGIPEIVNDDVGILVEKEQSDELATAILTALKKTWSQEKILTHAKKFNWQHNVENVVKHIS